jgi:hypothetical protein
MEKPKLNRLCVFGALAVACWIFGPGATAQDFAPGQIWPDTVGNHIQAHGGGILAHEGVYYWYGEDRTPGGDGAASCYSSTNLYDWKREGVALTRAEVTNVCGRRTFVERPKVLYNAATGKFVMWMHAEQGRYRYARAGVAVSDAATGPFHFLRAIRPVTQDVDFSDTDPCEQKQFGGTFRDMNVFQDDDGAAYVFYASEDNWTMYVARLNRDFTGPETPEVEGRTWARMLVREMREAPAPFKFHGKYYLITSACTGWKPNAAGVAVADNILGPWKLLGNPCRGPDAQTTFGAQSTQVLPAPGGRDGFIFMADRWQPANLPHSTYVWLPFQIGKDGSFTIDWRDHWSLAAFDGSP